jgi:hypothetical protein
VRVEEIATESGGLGSAGVSILVVLLLLLVLAGAAYYYYRGNCRQKGDLPAVHYRPDIKPDGKNCILFA